MADIITAESIVADINSQLAGKHNSIAFGILNCIAHHTPHSTIIRECKEMIQDNYGSMVQLLGENLVIKLQNY